MICPKLLLCLCRKCTKRAGSWGMASYLLQTCCNMKVTGECRTLVLPCGVVSAGFFYLFGFLFVSSVPVVRISCGLLMHHWVYCCSVFTLLKQSRIPWIKSDFSGKIWKQKNRWTNYPVISVSGVQLLHHWILEHLDLRMAKRCALLNPPVSHLCGDLKNSSVFPDSFMASFLGKKLF